MTKNEVEQYKKDRAKFLDALQIGVMPEVERYLSEEYSVPWEKVGSFHHSSFEYVMTHAFEQDENVDIDYLMNYFVFSVTDSNISSVEKIANSLIKSGATLNDSTPFSIPMLFMDEQKLSLDGREQALLKLMDIGVIDPNANCRGEYLVHTASDRGLKLLLQGGANVEQITGESENSYKYNSSRDWRMAFSDNDQPRGKTLLHNARSIERIQFLLEHGANPNSRDWNMRTPLMDQVAFGYQHEEINLSSIQKIEAIDLNLKFGADLEAKDSDGKTLLHHVAELGNESEVSHLLKMGANANAVDNEGNTFFHYALLADNVGVASLLLRLGSRIDVINKDGKTPMDYANDSMKQIIEAHTQAKALNKTVATPKRSQEPPRPVRKL